MQQPAVSKSETNLNFVDYLFLFIGETGECLSGENGLSLGISRTDESAGTRHC